MAIASEKHDDVAYSPLSAQSGSIGEGSSSDSRMDDRGGNSRFKIAILVCVERRDHYFIIIGDNFEHH